MNNIKGTVIASTIVPSSSGDTFATHDEVYGKGGYRSVSGISDLFSITSERVKQGMLVHVESEDAEYRLIDATQYTTISGWERTDIYDVKKAGDTTIIDLTTLSGYSSITEVQQILGINTIDTNKKAIDVLMYMFATAKIGGIDPPPTPVITDDGYYMMLIENFSDSWIQSATSDEKSAIRSVMNEQGISDKTQTVPSLKALSRIYNTKISYFNELTNMSKITDMSTDNYDVYTLTFDVPGYFYFLINTSITINSNTFEITTDFKNGKPSFLGDSTYIQIDDCDGNTIFEDSYLSDDLKEKYAEGLSSCYLFKQSGDYYSTTNKIGIKIPKIKN